ncbi:MAG: hypothetical protein IJW32_00185 [Clostridia bacterium]|nr:hypothetical protein [Clostridia bacterium]
MMKINDYNNYDVLNLYVKRDKLENIISKYTIFGWELEKQEDNKEYEDIVEITFVRPHVIKNKDDLQLLQVYMEERLNKVGQLERNKNAKTTSLALVFGVIGLAMIIFGLLDLIFNFFGFLIAGDIILLSVGAILELTGLLVVPKIHKKEKIDFDSKISILELEIENICERVKVLIGGKNGK